MPPVTRPHNPAMLLPTPQGPLRAKFDKVLTPPEMPPVRPVPTYVRELAPLPTPRGVSQVKPGTWSVYTRSEGPPWGTALLLPGLVAFEWKDAEGKVRTKAVYDVGEPVAGPLRIDGVVCEFDHDTKAFQEKIDRA